MQLQTTQCAIESAVKLAAGQLSSAAKQVDDNAVFPKANIEALAQEGLLGLVVPAEFGGLAANSKTIASTVAAVASGCASTGMILVMHCCGIEAVSKHMSGARRAEILSRAAKGVHLSSLAFSERGTGANFGATFSKSNKEQKGYSINGEKVFVTSGGHADSYVISARSPGKDEVTTTSLYLIERGADGASFEGEWLGVGLRGNSSIALKLNNCIVPPDALLGEHEQGLSYAMGTVLPLFLLATASVYHGIAQAAFSSCVNHVKARTHAHNSEALSNIAQIRRVVGEMKVKLDSSQALIDRAAAARDNQAAEAPLLLMEAKQMSTEIANEITKQAMHLCGGIAYTGALPLERHMRDALAGDIMAPTSDMLLDMIGRCALGLPLG